MSASGQKQTCAVHQSMSALPTIATAKADSRERSCPLYPRKETSPSVIGISAKCTSGSEQSSCGDKQNGNTLLYSRLSIQRIEELIAISVPLWLKSDPRAKLHDRTPSARLIR